MENIRLKKSAWEYDSNSPIGSKGGFGQVFVGQGNGHAKVAVKRLYITANDAAHRELAIADDLAGRPFQHVIPIYDAGLDVASGSYFVVMALAEGDLQKEVSKAPFAEKEAVAALLSIAMGLSEARHIVHRDLKPANVLKHDGRWKITDFGIARFAEDATATHTLKNAKSRPYAAPEQWKEEHATPATDIYALGCIAYALLTGHPPFSGPDFRQQHLHDTPPLLSCSPRLSSLVASMLRKQAANRPSVDRVVEQLEGVASDLSKGPGGSGFAALAQADALQSGQIAASDATASKEKAEQQDRKDVTNEAIQILLQDVVDPLFHQIRQIAQNVASPHTHTVKLGLATLDFTPPPFDTPVPRNAFRSTRWDVLAQAVIEVTQAGQQPYGRGANLWYLKRPNDAEYRWWELSYMQSPLVGGFIRHEPYALPMGEYQQADLAAAPIMATIQHGSTPKIVDGEYAQDFQNRWAKVFADAVNGQLRMPSTLPLP